MSGFNRRHFLQISAAAAAAAPAAVRAQTGAYHVVVAGGGFAGATAAKYIRLWGGSAIRVTLVNPSAVHTSCIMSNLVLHGSLGLKDLRFGLNALGAYGVNFLKDFVDGVDVKQRLVKLRVKGWMPYDRLVLAGGISFKGVQGLNYSKHPHAWIAGSQTTLLKSQIAAMPDNGVFVMSVPPAPYRCPPGPYERACTVAAILKARGGRPKVIVLDANSDIQAEKATFSKAFSTIYKGIISYRPGVTIKSVNSATREVLTSAGPISGDVLNIIPPHRASLLARKAGAAPAGSDWAPVDPLTYESTLAGFSGVHVIGDSQGTAQPKSGHMANSQAKVCADAIVRLFNGESVTAPDRIANIVTNSACYSPITATEASWLTAVFGYDPASKKMVLRPGSLAEAGSWSTGNYRQMFSWANNLWTDSFK